MPIWCQNQTVDSVGQDMLNTAVSPNLSKSSKSQILKIPDRLAPKKSELEVFKLQSNSHTSHFAFMDEFTLIPLSSLDRIQKQSFEIISKTSVTRVCTTAPVCSKKKHLIHEFFSIFTALAIFQLIPGSLKQ